MKRNLFILSTLLSLAATGASARKYDIKLDGYCDRLELFITDGKVFGASLAKPKGVPCDNSLLTGTAVITRAPVAPVGRIFTAAGDLGQSPLQFVNYIDLASHTFTLYGTGDGVTIAVLPGTWSAVAPGADADADGVAVEPSITSAFFKKAKILKPAP